MKRMQIAEALAAITEPSLAADVPHYLKRHGNRHDDRREYRGDELRDDHRDERNNRHDNDHGHGPNR